MPPAQKKTAKMTRLAYWLWMCALALLAALLAPYACGQLRQIFLPSGSLLASVAPFAWIAAGAAAYGIFRFFVKRNMRWLETQSHELTHSFVAILFGRRVLGLEAKEGSGVIYTSGTSDRGLIPMHLAPYCLPWITLLLLALRPIITAEGLPIFDIIVGVTMSFYIVCFWTQTGAYQTDINQYPLSFSYTYIYTLRAIWAMVILVAYLPEHNIFTSLWSLLRGLWSSLLWYTNLIF